MISPPVTSTNGVKDFYDDPAVVERYLEQRTVQPFGAVLHQRQVAFLRQAMARLSTGRVLDLAPGPARLSAELTPPGLAVAMDHSFNMLRAAHRRVAASGDRWQLMQGDGYHLPFPAESFDLIYSVRFIRRFDRPRREALYAEIRRVLKRNGFFVMDAQNRVVALPHRLARGPEKYPVYDELFLRHELLNELEENGFRVIQLEGIMRRFALQFWLNRLRRLRLSAPARWLIRALEYTNDRNPSSWMVLCQSAQGECCIHPDRQNA
jgi:ubiquinone/menaquinone biosynthesis C-methylase UbiE